MTTLPRRINRAAVTLFKCKLLMPGELSDCGDFSPLKETVAAGEE